LLSCCKTPAERSEQYVSEPGTEVRPFAGEEPVERPNDAVGCLEYPVTPEVTGRPVADGKLGERADVDRQVHVVLTGTAFARRCPVLDGEAKRRVVPVDERVIDRYRHRAVDGWVLQRQERLRGVDDPGHRPGLPFAVEVLRIRSEREQVSQPNCR